MIRPAVIDLVDRLHQQCRILIELYERYIGVKEVYFRSSVLDVRAGRPSSFTDQRRAGSELEDRFLGSTLGTCNSAVEAGERVW